MGGLELSANSWEKHSAAMPDGSERAEDHWLVLDYPDNLPIRIDSRALDRVLVDAANLILDVGPVTVALTIGGGETVARSIGEQLAVFTRSAPIASDPVLRLAKERLELASRGRHENGTFIIFVGREDVCCHDDHVYYGDRRVCSLAELRACIARRDVLLLDPKAFIQPSLILLCLGACERRENLETLAEKIREYESRSTTVIDHG